MTDNRTTTNANRNGISAERARQILSEGKYNVGGKNIYVFNNTMSDLPPSKNEELVGSDFVIHSLAGEVTTEYGEAWIFEIGSTVARPTRSWLVGKPAGNKNDSVVGRNLKRHFDRNGSNAFPIFVHMAYHDEGRGNAYYALEAPLALRRRAEDEQESAEALPEPSAGMREQVQRQVQQMREQIQQPAVEKAAVPAQKDDYEDLPF